MNTWELPSAACFGGVTYPIHADYRDVLNICKHLNDPDQPEYVRWRIALALFYQGDIPAEHWNEAMAYLGDFISCGRQDGKPGPKLLDWEQDAQVIVADVNKTAGLEIRSLPFLHWWTFLSYFHAIGEGQLSTLVSIREKLRTGKKLEKWEQEYYQKNRARVDMKKQYSAEELAQKARLEAMLRE